MRRQSRWLLLQLSSHHTRAANTLALPAALDAAFLQSWLHLDTDSATKLASDGAAAAATRRELLSAAAADGTFGANALPGAYPAPPPPAKSDVKWVCLPAVGLPAVGLTL